MKGHDTYFIQTPSYSSFHDDESIVTKRLQEALSATTKPVAVYRLWKVFQRSDAVNIDIAKYEDES